MHRGFNLKTTQSIQADYDQGQKLYESHDHTVKRLLTDFINARGSIDGSQLQDNWFPQIKADIFISHSHGDEKKAKAIAGKLYSQFGLVSFIDSCVWGNADNLLKTLIRPSYNEKEGCYYLDEVTKASSHVHMMLSIALTMMIDYTECLFFLNTDESVIPTYAQSKTTSPWLYLEVSVSRYIRKRSAIEHRPKQIKQHSDGGRFLTETKLPPIEHELYLRHLTNITTADLDRWYKEYHASRFREEYPLDRLYELYPEKKSI